MLVLTRQNQQCIRIGKEGEILIKVLCNKKGQVRIGIEAPRDIPVDREEVFWRKHANILPFSDKEEEKDKLKVKQAISQ